ncbi:hypothetical protein HYFRA_00001966 [Hymenoscyphus fraxineus]|uniref:Heterokaryon incompatibility domain-containing protein n=1 Tax=Hymenoscyphus fraxineus TaxID=746836 RepID=A0A9N9KKW0_9HELO|nr:hypothetical protein HYFRA_00001966 [Hymenoscyphus fraxineus]
MHFWEKYTTTVPLCKQCRTLDLCSLLLNPRDPIEHNYQGVHANDSDGSIHHKKFKYLRRTAAKGCKLCKLILKHWGHRKDLTPFGQAHDREHDMVVIAAIGRSKGGDGKKRFRPYVCVFSQPWCEELGEVGRKKVECSFEVLPETYVMKKGQEGNWAKDCLKVILGRRFGSEPQAQTSLALAHTWIEKCHKRHPECSQARIRTPAPTRLLQVGSASEDPKLCLTHPEDCEWVALSYCWGGHSNFRLTRDRLGSFQRRMPYKEFPKTIRDAVLVTRALGIKYLWVDALCIVQDSKEDWGYESTKMSDVYRGAVITISASSAAKTTEGFLHQRKLQTNNCVVPWKCPEPDDNAIVKDQKLRKHCISLGFSPSANFTPNTASLRFFDEEEPRRIGLDTGPLTTRGWVLQEELFSGRRLIFREDQMVWECSTAKFCEGGFSRQFKNNYSPNLWSTFNNLAKCNNARDDLTTEYVRKVSVTWYQTIGEYLKRQLSYPTDRLPAIASLAKEFQKLNGGDTYCAGIWRSDMIRGLCWNPLYNKWDMPQVTPNRDPRKTYSGPSWSWASLDPWPLEVKHPKFCFEESEIEGKIKYAANIRDVVIEHSSSNSFGEVASGSVTLDAPFYYIDEFDEDEKRPVSQRPFTDESEFRQLDEFQAKHEGYSGQHFAIIILLETLGQYHILFLESLKPKGQDEVQAYRRISYSTMKVSKTDTDEMSSCNWDGARKEVKIV